MEGLVVVLLAGARGQMLLPIRWLAPPHPLMVPALLLKCNN